MEAFRKNTWKIRRKLLCNAPTQKWRTEAVGEAPGKYDCSVNSHIFRCVCVFVCVCEYLSRFVSSPDSASSSLELRSIFEREISVLIQWPTLAVHAEHRSTQPLLRARVSSNHGEHPRLMSALQRNQLPDGHVFCAFSSAWQKSRDFGTRVVLSGDQGETPTSANLPLTQCTVDGADLRRKLHPRFLPASLAGTFPVRVSACKVGQIARG